MSSQLDWRLRTILSILRVSGEKDTLRGLHKAIEREIAKRTSRAKELSESGASDYAASFVDGECEQIEELLGLGFVAAQSFIATVRNRWKSIARTCKAYGIRFTFPTDSRGLLEQVPVLPCKYHAAEAVNAVANYWKHNGEWPETTSRCNGRTRLVWDIQAMRPPHQRTATIAVALGMAAGSTGNLRTATSALGARDYANLSIIRELLFEWSNDLYNRAQNELYGMKDKLYLVKGQDPSALTPSDLIRCIDIIAAGAAVDIDSVQRELPVAVRMSTALKDDQIVGVGCIKRKRPDYTRGVMGRAGATCDDTAHELGYVAVDEQHRGNHLSDRIVLSLIEDVDFPLFATTANEWMAKTLTKAGFAECGNRWIGQSGNELSLWYRKSGATNTGAGK